MAPIARSISEAELSVLKQIWEGGPGSVREIQERLDEEQAWAYTTVQTLLNRLEQKGYLESAKVGRAFVFRAAVSREELLDQELGDLAERVCDGTTLPLVMRLVQARSFEPDELARFRALLDDLEQEPGERRAGRRSES